MKCNYQRNTLTKQLSIILSKIVVFIVTPVCAQITPDNTLGTENFRITPNTLINGASSDLISGGALRSSNLFHSFSQFNIQDRQRVYFANPSGVLNIITRVTGASTSNIKRSKSNQNTSFSNTNYRSPRINQNKRWTIELVATAPTLTPLHTTTQTTCPQI